MSIAASSFVAVFAALAAAELTPRRPRAAAFAAGMLAAAHPMLARLGGQVMAYSVAHVCLAAAVLLTVVALKRRSLLLSCGAGLVLGIGYMARSDVLVSGLGLGLGVSALALLRRPRLPLLPVAFLAGTLIGMAPYAIAIRAHAGEWRLSLKKQVGHVLRVPDPPGEPPPVSEASPSLRQLILLETGSATPPRPGLFGSMLFAGRVALETGPYWIVLLALLGVIVRARDAPEWIPIALAIAVFVAVQGLLKANWNTTDKIHQSSLGVLLAPLAARGLLLASAGPLRRAGIPRRLGTAALLAACLVPLLWKIKPNLPGRATERAVGEWIRQDAGPGPLLVAGWETRVVARRAEARFLALGSGPPAEALEEARAAGATYLAVYLRSRAPLREDLAPAVTGTGMAGTLVRFAAERDGKTYTWLVFRLPPKRG